MSTSVSIKVVGADVVRQGLENLDRDIPRIGAARIFAAMNRARKRVTTYPPPIPTSRYKRTGTYKRSFQVRRNPRSGLRKNVGYTLFGRAVQKGRDYTRYVGGDAFGRRQASIHENRWPVIREIVEDEVKGLPREIEDNVRLSIKRNRL